MLICVLYVSIAFVSKFFFYLFAILIYLNYSLPSASARYFTDNRYLFEFHLHRMTQLPSTEESPVK